MKKYISTPLLVLLMFLVYTCNRKTSSSLTEKKLHKNCYLTYDPGPCRMAIKRYYYDKKEMKCKEFIYGGCKGVVPFETLEACEKGCECD